MKRKILLSITALVAVFLGVPVYRYVNRESFFMEDAFVQLRGGKGSESVTDIELKSGDSASVILEHSCCSGAGFDAVAVRTSDGQEFFAKKNYCGLEGFWGSLRGDCTIDLPRFTAFLAAEGYQKN